MRLAIHFLLPLLGSAGLVFAASCGNGPTGIPANSMAIVFLNQLVVVPPTPH